MLRFLIRTIEKSAELVDLGVSAVQTPLEVLSKSDCIFIMVSDGEAVQDIFSGADGLLKGELSGKIFVNMSTVSPGINRSLAEIVNEKGATFIDAPVSGSVMQAEQGQLVILGGGDKKVFDELTPLFDTLGKMSIYVGPSGSGNELKLIINSLLAIITQGFAEALLATESKGIELDKFLTLLNNSALSNIFLKAKGDILISGNYNAAFALKHLVKDLNLAKQENILRDMGNLALQDFQSAAVHYGDQDVIAVKKSLDGQSAS
ncbi:NAD(P)-dependent oxidoreductase [Chryseobacterium taichungense]|uniref:NAD(P)-dependent oxidoreductase n=1 Tax=Chryseobacterium taichungense TaxID=295069 RepID=UPI0028B24FA2|nr:NAD(P)-dependent oxidoreductase [Chryseobacterium taichungense]